MRVPVALIRPYVVQHVAEMEANEMGAVRHETTGGKTMTIAYDQAVTTKPEVYSALEALAFRAGLSESIVRRIWKGNREWVSYETADKLLAVGMHDFTIWYNEELYPYYMEEIVTAPPRSGRNQYSSPVAA